MLHNVTKYFFVLHMCFILNRKKLYQNFVVKVVTMK